MQANIRIVGQIGSTPATPSTPPVKGVDLTDIIAQARQAIQSGAKTIVVGYNSPGGYVDVGNPAYDYLMSLKKDGVKLVSTTIPNKDLTPVERQMLGLTEADIALKPDYAIVGSIASKMFMSGDDRELGPADDFFIHNPWMNPGPSDGNKLLESAEIAKAEEAEMRDFYAKATGNTVEALKPLMDAETSLSAPQAISLGFATKMKDAVKASGVFAKINFKANHNTMKDDKTIGQKLDALLALVSGGTKGKVKADVTFQDTAGKTYFLDNDFVADLSDPAAVGSPVYLAGPDGTPSPNVAPDGPLNLANGMVVTIAKGAVSAVKPASAAAPATTTPAGVPAEQFNAFKAEVEKTLGTITDVLTKMQASMQAAPVSESVLEQKIAALKKEIGTIHTPPRVKMTAAQRKEALRELSPIQRKMRGIKEEDLA